MFTIMLDVGGTEIKAGIADETGELVGEIKHYPARSDRTEKEIFDNLSKIIKERMLSVWGNKIGAISMAFPGPFDYEKGISYMQNLGKYESIYGVSIPDELQKRIPEMENVKICFAHDVEAFAVGAYHNGKTGGRGKAIFVCIGTGAGSAFVENGKVLKEPQSGVPENGWIYNTPFRDSVIDDYLSVRGLDAICQRIMEKSLSGLELYQLCMSGNKNALAVYKEFGEILADCLVDFLDKYVPDTLVFGGQISKSFLFFGDRVTKLCREKNIKILMEPDTSYRTMQGLYMIAQRRKTDGIS